MKILSLLITALLIISCNTSSSKDAIVTTTDQIEKVKEVIPEVVKEEIKTIEEKVEIIEEKVTSTLSEKKEELKEKAAVKKEIVENNEVIVKEKVAVKSATVKEAIPAKVIEKPVVVRPNHDAWNVLTKTYVSNKGKVNYKGFKSALPKIEAYLLHLENTPPKKDWSRNEKLAYWFNLYNASTVHLVASNYPVSSIMDINNGKPWDKKFVKSGANVYSLNEIENSLVRPNYNEPRLHVAFNCAAISCPSLANEAFVPAKLNRQLNALSKQWINDASKNSISSDKLQISKIFDWYKVDFKEGVIPFINKYTNQEKISTDTEISYLEYDWKLNE